MTTLQVIILAIVQGLTEFLPISSSGHLVLVPHFFDWTDQGLAFDVAVHFGSLIAVMLFFRKDIFGLLRGGVQVLGGNVQTVESRLALGIALGTVPAALAGLLFVDWIEANLRSPFVIIFTLSGYGLLMIVADRWGKRERDITSMTVRDAVLIGVAQALALIPGTSRSGITITAARFMGFERQDAARFSFLLAVPVILLATGYSLLGLLSGEAAVAWGQLATGVAVSAIVAYLSIEFFMRFVSRIGLLPFAVYRLILAVVIVYVLV
jgi:undecaprenyl-diphosphatase